MIRTLTLTGMLLLVFVIGWVFISKVHWGDPVGKWQIQTTSPDSTYLIQVEGENFPPSRSYSFYSHGDHEANFNLFKQGNSIITHEPLYGGDGFDNLFLTLYPSYEWVSANTLRFGEKKNLPQSQQDEILVSNNTGEYLRYVRINFGGDEMFIVVDLPSKATTHLYAQPQTDEYSDLSGITCVARKAGPYMTKRADFDIRGKYKAPAHYFIDVGISDIKITSQEFEPISKLNSFRCFRFDVRS
jgi:hypothetical protein